MYYFDPAWLNGIQKTGHSSRKSIDIKERAQEIESLFIQYLGMESSKFAGNPPLRVIIKPVEKFPWLDYRWQQGNGGIMHLNVPVRDRIYPVVGRFNITLAPKFLEAHSDDLLIMMDYVLYKDSRSIKAYQKTFGGPEFGKNRGPRPSEATYECRSIKEALKNVAFIDGKARNYYLKERFLDYSRSKLSHDLKLKPTPECFDKEYLYQMFWYDDLFKEEDYEKLNKHFCECELCFARYVEIFFEPGWPPENRPPVVSPEFPT